MAKYASTTATGLSTTTKDLLEKKWYENSVSSNALYKKMLSGVSAQSAAQKWANGITRFLTNLGYQANQINTTALQTYEQLYQANFGAALQHVDELAQNRLAGLQKAHSENKWINNYISRLIVQAQV